MRYLLFRTWLLCCVLTLLGLIPDATGATIEVESGTLRATGIRLAESSLPLEFRAGPRETQGGVTSRVAGILQGTLEQRLGRSGSLQFWFHVPAHFRSSESNEYSVHPLVEIPGVITTCFIVEASSINFYAGWGARKDVETHGAGGTRRDVTFERRIRAILPEWPGPAWHHVAVHWNSVTGEANLHLNGTPYHFAGSRIEPWTANESDQVRMHVGPRFAVGALTIAEGSFDPLALRQSIGAEHFGKLDALLGVRSHGRLAMPIARGKTVYARKLGAETDVAGWVMEGPGELAFREGWMELRSRRPDGPNGHVVFWPPEKFPPRVIVEFDFEMVSATGLNILFFAAQPRQPGLSSIFDAGLARRDGTFIGYTHGDIDSYHVSYFANAPAEPRAVSNLRKNSGFYLLANGPVSLARGGEGRQCQAVLLLDGRRIVMAVDGEILIDFTDDGARARPALAGGNIGFRQMQWSVCRYRNLRVHELAGEIADYCL